MKIKKEWNKRGVVVSTFFLLFCFFLITMTGCGAASYESAMKDDARAVAPAPSAPMEDKGVAEEKGIEHAEAGELAPEAVGKRYIIQNAYLNLEIHNIDETVTKLYELVDLVNGYVASREIYSISEERRAGRVTVRIPAEHFNPLLEEIKELGKVKNDHIDTDDVTMDYIDLEARIANLTTQEKRLRELLEKAESIEDILQVERELGRVRGDLEAMTGNFKYLQERVRYSTIEIRMEERDARTVVVTDRFDSFGERVMTLLALNTNRLLTFFSDFTALAIGSLPIIIPLLLVFYLVWRIRVYFRNKRMMKQEQK